MHFHFRTIVLDAINELNLFVYFYSKSFFFSLDINLSIYDYARTTLTSVGKNFINRPQCLHTLLDNGITVSKKSISQKVRLKFERSFAFRDFFWSLTMFEICKFLIVQEPHKWSPQRSIFLEDIKEM